jgi:hypothetical protein
LLSQEQVAELSVRPLGIFLIKNDMFEKGNKINLDKKHSIKFRKKRRELMMGNKINLGRCREKSPRWKGGRIKDKDGYILIKQREHPFSNYSGYVWEHRIIVEKILERFLSSEETVHHIGEKGDNRIEMLMVFKNQATHMKFEMGKEIAPEDIIFDGAKLKGEDKMEKNNESKVTKELVIIESLREPMALGEVFMRSGMFKDVKSQAQAVVKIIAGKEIGLAPMESMQNIYMTPDGKIGVMAKIVGALIKKSKKYDYTLEKLEDAECIISFFSIDNDKRIELGKSIFTTKDAAKAGLINKDNYKNYPRNMNFARALMNGARWYTPDVYCGYAVEELEKTEEITSVITIDKKGEVKNGESA